MENLTRADAIKGLCGIITSTFCDDLGNVRTTVGYEDVADVDIFSKDGLDPYIILKNGQVIMYRADVYTPDPKGNIIIDGKTYSE